MKFIGPKYCDQCGAEVTKNANYCAKCRANIKEMPIIPQCDEQEHIDDLLRHKEDITAKREENVISKLTKLFHNKSLDTQTKIERIIHATGITCGIIALQPIPFADILILTPIQTSMVLFIGKVKGMPISKKRAGEILMEIIGVLGAGLVSQHAVILAYKTFLPYAGGAFTIPIVWGLTYGIGRASAAYYDIKLKSNKQLDIKDKEYLREVYAEGFLKGKKDGAKEKDNIRKEMNEELEMERKKVTVIRTELEEAKNIIGRKNEHKERN